VQVTIQHLHVGAYCKSYTTLPSTFACDLRSQHGCVHLPDAARKSHSRLLHPSQASPCLAAEGCNRKRAAPGTTPPIGRHTVRHRCQFKNAVCVEYWTPPHGVGAVPSLFLASKELAQELNSGQDMLALLGEGPRGHPRFAVAHRSRRRAWAWRACAWRLQSGSALAQSGLGRGPAQCSS
jgi:hypothetical protein